MSFSVINQFFLVGVQNFPFFDNLAQKTCTLPKHYKHRGFSKAFFEKQMCITKRPFLDKKTNSEIPAINFFASFFSCNNTTQIICWKPYFYSVLANKKEKQTKITYDTKKKQSLQPFLRKKAIFRKLADNCAQKTQNGNWVCKNRLKTL